MRKMLAVVLLLLPFTLNAQIPALQLKGERKLNPLPPVASNSKAPSARCGSYFLFLPNAGELSSGPSIAYWLQSRNGDPSVNGRTIGLVMNFLRKKFRVVVDETKDGAPSSELLGRPANAVFFNPSDVDQVVIRISSADLAESKCLPAPSE